MIQRTDKISKDAHSFLQVGMKMEVLSRPPEPWGVLQFFLALPYCRVEGKELSSVPPPSGEEAEVAVFDTRSSRAGVLGQQDTGSAVRGAEGLAGRAARLGV